MDQNMVDRLDNLERECKSLRRRARCWRSLGLVLGLGIVTIGAGQADDILKIRQLEIVDKGGKARIVLTAEPEPQMLFYGDKSARLGLGLGGAGVPSDAPYLNMRDAESRPRLVMGITGPTHVPKPTPGFTIKEITPPDPIGTPYFALRGEQGAPFFRAK